MSGYVAVELRTYFEDHFAYCSRTLGNVDGILAAGISRDG